MCLNVCASVFVNSLCIYVDFIFMSISVSCIYHVLEKSRETQSTLYTVSQKKRTPVTILNDVNISLYGTVAIIFGTDNRQRVSKL